MLLLSVFGSHTDYVLAYEQPKDPNEKRSKQGPGLCSKLLALLTKRPQGVNVDETEPTEDDKKEAEKLNVKDVKELTLAARRKRYIQRLKDYADVREEKVSNPYDGSSKIVFQLVTLYDDVLAEAAYNMALTLTKNPPTVSFKLIIFNYFLEEKNVQMGLNYGCLQKRYPLIEGHWASRLFYGEVCSRKRTPGTERCAPLVNPVYTTEFGSVATDKDNERSANVPTFYSINAILHMYSTYGIFYTGLNT